MSKIAFPVVFLMESLVGPLKPSRKHSMLHKVPRS